MPGDTTYKTGVVANSGEVDEAVRISYAEVWKSSNAKLTDEEENNDKVAIINFSNTNYNNDLVSILWI